VTRRVAPPSGWPAPRSAKLAGRDINLTAPAEAVADRYFAEFPDDLARYGDAARAWEVHDTAYCLQWAVLDVEGWNDLGTEVAWLANVLRSRGFPLDRLARNLELAADVVEERLASDGTAVAARLRRSAAWVRESKEEPAQ
jgi:hypothetical protein